MNQKYLATLTLLVALLRNQVLAGVISQQRASYYSIFEDGNTNEDLNPQPREGKVIDIKAPNVTNIFNDLSRLLQGTTSLLRTIVETKKATIGPLLETAIEAKKSLLDSPIVKTVVETKTDLVKNLASAAPQITAVVTGVVGSALKAAPALIKAGICNLICPISGQEKCRKDHCEDSSEKVASNADLKRRDSGPEDYDAYGDYSDAVL